MLLPIKLGAELERLELNMKTSRLERISNHVEVIMNLNLNKFDYIVFVLTYAVYDNLLVCMLLLYALEWFLEEHFKI